MSIETPFEFTERVLAEVSRERDDLRTENERLRMALREALERATACAPVDRLGELGQLWAVLDGDKQG